MGIFVYVSVCGRGGLHLRPLNSMGRDLEPRGTDSGPLKDLHKSIGDVELQLEYWVA